MPTYNDLRPSQDYEEKDYTQIFPRLEKKEEKVRIINNLLNLKKGLDKEIPAKKTDKNLIIGSWNIKEFGHTTQRLPDAYYFIAEIINRFDLLAVQEIKSHLNDLELIMSILGTDWEYIVNDITEGDAGNSERSAYLYNKKRVTLSGVAGELVSWSDLTQDSEVKQLKRTPYITGFKAGWKIFSMVNLHLHPGDGDDNIEYRKKEVELLLKIIDYKITRGRFWNDNLVIVGDMNLYKGAAKDDDTVKLFVDNSFKEVDGLIGKKTNTSKTEIYDRMFHSDNNYFTLQKDDNNQEKGDVFDLFDYVFKQGEEQVYKKYMKAVYSGSKDLDVPANLEKYYRVTWKRNQMSDHLPIWTELIIDSSDLFLQKKLQGHDEDE